MIKKYPFSPGTSEDEALQKLSGNERVAILQATNIYQDAVNEALNCNHPRLKAFQNWLERDIKIKAWYEQNQDQIKLVEDGIEVQGLVFCLENEVASDNGTDIWNNEGHTYFTFNAAQRHAAEHGKRVPTDAEWQKLIDFLPANQEASFFKDVLKIPLAGLRYTDGVTFDTCGNFTVLWSSTPSAGNAYYRYMYWDYLTVHRNSNSQAYGFSVRCLIDTY